MRKRISILLIAVFLVSLIVTANAAIKPGTTCKKLGMTIVSASKKYTCIKQGKELRWDKGTVIENSKKNTSFIPPDQKTHGVIPTNSNNGVSNLEGSACSKSGLQIKVNEVNYYECRFKHGKRREWVTLSYSPSKIFNLTNLTDVSACKIKDHSKTAFPNSGANGFPVIPTEAKFPTKGVIRLAILPVDFAEFPGDTNINEELNLNINKMRDWFSFFSHGKLRVEFTTVNKWIRSPLPASYYDKDTGHPELSINSATNLISQAYVNLAPSNFDFNQIAMMFVLFPQKQNVINTLIQHEMDFDTLQGKQKFWVLPFTYNEQVRRQPPWAAWIHDLMHHIGLSGHAPGNGFPISVMTGNLGNSYPLTSWDQFIIEWLEDNQVYCLDKNDISNKIYTISPLEREDFAPKAIMIPLTDHSIIVIESHAVDKWSVRDDPAYSMKDGFYGVMVYLVDTRFQNDRSNEVVSGYSLNYCQEYYKQTRICNQAVTNETNDNGNDPRFPKFAYYMPVEGGRSTDWDNFTPYTVSNNIIADYIAVEGDEFIVNGVRIKFIRTGDYNDVQISKVS